LDLYVPIVGRAVCGLVRQIGTHLDLVTPAFRVRTLRRLPRLFSSQHHIQSRTYDAQMCALLDLPDELLLLIMDELRDDGCCDRHESSVDISISAFHSLTRVCLRLGFIATPYLYSNVTNKKSLHTLLLTIAKFPESAEHMQRIHWNRDRAPDYNKLSATAPRDRILEQMRLLGLRFSIRYNNIRILDPNSSMDFFATILCFTPNVQFLNVVTGQKFQGHYYQKQETPVWLDVLRAGPSHGYFQNLHTVRLQMGALTLDDLLPVFQLPCLNALELEDLTTELGRNWESCPPRSLSLQKLTLQHTNITATGIIHLSSHIKALHELRILLSRPLNGSLYYPSLDYPLLTKALHIHKDTLESLDVTVSRDEALYHVQGTLYVTSTYKLQTRDILTSYTNEKTGPVTARTHNSIAAQHACSRRSLWIRSASQDTIGPPSR
jgi:hypothetical protein